MTEQPTSANHDPHTARPVDLRPFLSRLGKPKMRRVATVVVLTAVAAAVPLALTAHPGLAFSSSSAVQPVAAPLATQGAVQAPTSDPEFMPVRALNAPSSFAPLVKRVAPAVVNISSARELTPEESAMGPEGMPQFPPGSPFEHFFKRFFEQQQGQGGGHAQPQKVQSLGSGFIIDSTGYVVTNNHVIDGAQEVKVILNDGNELPAKIIGTDAKTDLALLKVDTDQALPSVPWGNSDQAEVGDWVVAVGNPFGLGGTVTTGIVSARGRDIGSGPFDEYMQIDAAINRGNSGGPTFDLSGNVIGINTAIYSPNGGSVGIGFAVPANIAKPVIAQLKATGSVERGWLGVKIQGVTDEIAQSLGMPEAKGALVAGIEDGSPAAKAGVQQGDVIVGFAGEDVPEMRKLPWLVANTEPGKTVDLKVWRGDHEQNLSVKLAKLDDGGDKTVQVSQNTPDEAQGLHVPALGMTVRNLDDALRQKAGVADDVKGVVVVDVDGDGPAASRGLRPGDVIARVGQTEVKTDFAFEKQVNEAIETKHKAVLLLVTRGDQQSFVTVPTQKS